MVTKDYYAVLGIKRTATLAAAKSAYRQLSMKYHPDRNPGDINAEKKFREIEEAYSVISDPKKRKEYDEGRASAMTDKPWQFAERQWQKIIEDIMR